MSDSLAPLSTHFQSSLSSAILHCFLCAFRSRREGDSEVQPGASGAKSSSLQKLCLWLEDGSTKEKSDLHFKVYYQDISGRLLRFLRWELWEPGRPNRDQQAQDLLQEVFTRLLSRLAKRPAAAARIIALGARLQWDARGSFYARRVHLWHQDAVTFSKGALGFCAEHCLTETPVDCNVEARNFNEHCDSLREGGYNLVATANIPCPGDQAGSPYAAGSASEGHPYTVEDGLAAHAQDAGFVFDQEQPPHNNARRLISATRALLKTGSVGDIDRQLGLLGATDFVIALADTLECLSILRVPTDALLYRMAKNLLYDDHRSGPAQCRQEFSLDEMTAPKGESSIAPEPQLQQRPIPEESCFTRDALVLLRKEVDLAEAALGRTAAPDERARAERCLAKKRRLFSEYSTILGLLSETGITTQDELAASLGLTRDQIRYRLKGMAKVLAPLRGTPQ